MAKRTIDWKNEGVELDPSSFSASLKKSYEAYVASRQTTAALRTKFEGDFATECPPSNGNEYLFGHNFGKLTVVETEATKKNGPSKKAVSLAAFKKR